MGEATHFKFEQEAHLLQKDHATCYVSKFVPFFTWYGSLKGFKQQSDLQSLSSLLAVVPFDRPHMISH